MPDETKPDQPPTTDEPTQWDKESAGAVIRELGLGHVLDEPESEMSRYYVTNSFTQHGDPLAAFRDKFEPLARHNLRELLERQNESNEDDPDEQAQS